MINSVGYHLHSLTGMQMLRDQSYELITNPYGRIYSDQELLAAVGDMDAVIADTENWNEAAFQAAEKIEVPDPFRHRDEQCRHGGGEETRYYCGQYAGI